VDLRLDSPVTNLDDVFNQGYDAVLIAVGAHEGIRLPIPGADLDGVLINTVFLRDVRLGHPPKLGDRVIVIGSGTLLWTVPAQLSGWVRRCTSITAGHSARQRLIPLKLSTPRLKELLFTIFQTRRNRR